MKKSASLLSNLLVSSTLFWGVPVAQGEQIVAEESLMVPAVSADYCHMQFPAIREDSLSWARPVFEDNAVNSVDFYGSCDYDPLGIDEIKAQRRVMFREIYGDSE